MDSILTSIKKLLGITEEYDHFDTDLIIHINSALMSLTQIGVGPPGGFVIRDEDAIWSDFISDPVKLQAVKTYVYLKVKIVFDPPLNSSVIAAMEKQIAEYEWRLNVAAETQTTAAESQSVSDGITLKDRDTNSEYELYVSSGSLKMGKKE